jgi:FMN phosphatase YigB (HAD superfamily)
MQTLVIFDVGGVLVQLNSKRVFEELTKHSKYSMEEVMQRVAASGIERDLNLGDTQAYYDGIRKAVGIDISDEEIRRIRRFIIPDKAAAMVELKRRLHDAGHMIGLLSTVDEIGFSHIEKNWPEIYETWGGPKMYSHEAQVLKPDAKAYVPFVGMADRIIFIDDKSAYLKYPIEELGWFGILFTPFQDMYEPIRFVAGNHSEVAIENERFFTARSAEDVERILGEIGLEF